LFALMASSGWKGGELLFAGGTDFFAARFLIAGSQQRANPALARGNLPSLACGIGRRLTVRNSLN
jgi:hypothetical protein